MTTNGPGVVLSAANTIPHPNAAPGEEDRGVSLEDIYRTFFFHAFKGPPAAWKFIRSCIHALLRPASLNPATDCGPRRRYLSAVHLAETVFSIAAATSIVNFYSAVEPGSQSQGGIEPWLEKYVLGPFESAYLLWLFGTVLIASLLLERLWLRFTKAQVLPRRELATLFVYEVCVLLLPLLAILTIGEYRLLDTPSPGLMRALIVFVILVAVHLFVFLFQLGGRARLPLWRRVWTSVVVLYLVVFAMLPGELLALPFAFLPFLLVLYPLYAVLRDYLPKPHGLKRLFDRVQGVLEADVQ